jgi:hypothetical protein
MIGQLKIRKPIYVTEYGAKATNQDEPRTIDGQNPKTSSTPPSSVLMRVALFDEVAADELDGVAHRLRGP